MKVLFFGTPEFGADVFRELLKSHHEVIGVVCQMDKIGHRNKPEVREVKQSALDQCITVYQFKDVNQSVDRLKSLGADIFVTAAYGQILSQEVLDIPRYGVVNVHPSLLPKYRGASPVQFALLNGDKVTGVTIARTALKLDSGNILAQQEIEIDSSDNSNTVLTKTARLGGRILITVMDNMEEGRCEEAPQDETLATYTTKITTEMCKINWSDSAQKIFNQVRALAPEPAAFCLHHGKVLKVLDCEVVKNDSSAANGMVVQCDKSSVHVKCQEGAISLKLVQPAGGKVINNKDFFNGRKVMLGDCFE